MATTRRAVAARGVTLILAAFPDRATATRAARALVREGHLACATVAPGARAHYRWEGRLRDEPSVLLWGKTSSRAAVRATKALRALHPDRVPEILAFRAVGALPAYAAWVSAETGRKR